MLLRTCIALLLLCSACATTEPSPKGPVALNSRIANLQRAAALPWEDDGHCVVQEASNEWAVLVEKCFHALDHERIAFHDPTGRCAVASAGAAAMGMGICILVAPEIVVGAVIITGAVVVAVAIKEELDAYERRASRERARPESQTQASNKREPQANRKPKPEGSASEDFFPPLPTEPRPHRPECEPIPGPPRGGNDPHNLCADNIPNNNFPGLNVFVNGKHFDALQLATRTLWEVKTDNFDKHSPRSQDFFVRVKLPEIQREKRLAEACGYNFVVGVRSATHKAALLDLDPDLTVVVMDWC
jgi:uncharacterized protein DUF6310